MARTLGLDGHPVAVSIDRDTAQVWDLATAEQITWFSFSIGYVLAVACSVLEGQPVAVTASNDGTARVWDLATAEEITTFTGHTDYVHAVACSVLEGQPIAITASDDGTARVWDLATANEIHVFDGRAIGSAAVGPSGEIVIATGWELVVLDRTAGHKRRTAAPRRLPD